MRQLQVLAHGGIEYTYADPVYQLFFTHYYKDVFAKLNREQRLSYQTTHAAIESLNKGNEALAQHVAALRDPHRGRLPAGGDVAPWGDRIKVLYMQARTATWHVEYHLANPKRPVLDDLGPVHESFLKFQQGLQGEIAELMQKAKSLKRDDFLKVYDERAFRATPDRHRE
jgi:hypothetical protein